MGLIRVWIWLGFRVPAATVSSPPLCLHRCCWPGQAESPELAQPSSPSVLSPALLPTVRSPPSLFRGSSRTRLESRLCSGSDPATIVAGRCKPPASLPLSHLLMA
uniref:Secreted protein n=1 Tax=Opuntia streptacantha TaxID=393608 RepID=A0A7C9CRF5_OPUST